MRCNAFIAMDRIYRHRRHTVLYIVCNDYYVCKAQLLRKQKTFYNDINLSTNGNAICTLKSRESRDCVSERYETMYNIGHPAWISSFDLESFASFCFFTLAASLICNFALIEIKQRSIEQLRLCSIDKKWAWHPCTHLCSAIERLLFCSKWAIKCEWFSCWIWFYYQFSEFIC